MLQDAIVDIDIKSEDRPYRKGIIREIERKEFTFELQIQLCSDLEKMSINYLVKEWGQEESPFQTIEGNGPIGSLQRSRQLAYKVSSTSHHDLNHKKEKNLKILQKLLMLRFTNCKPI